ncbi:hypothetical protein ALTERO38_50292 [Alteromonas sp. 38]|nr:hypothetical protein ALTER154_80978 [Alteromonas sp. 154]VXB27601.1 hypothetical protein ALTERO38_50292 [Alteromonas sp. 38]
MAAFFCFIQALFTKSLFTPDSLHQFIQAADGAKPMMPTHFVQGRSMPEHLYTKTPSC